MRRWLLLGFLSACLCVGEVLGSSYEASARAEVAGLLTPFGSRAAAKRGDQRRRQLLADWNKVTAEDSLVDLLKQGDAGIRPDKVDQVEVGNVLLDAPRYHSNKELQEYLHGFVRRCGHVASLEQFGNSTLGTPLWALEISDHPGVEEPEPAFKFVGNMHGDEPTGRELVLFLAEWLCANHKVDPQAKRIVERLHLYLVPSLNPDGFARRQRGNPNGIDLNRDFPDQFFTNNNDLAHRQAETQALMNWTLSHTFTAGASLHEGAVVANYPWDGSTDQGTHYAEAPDDTAFRHLASAYAQGHAHMWNSSEFKGGITNGAAWYPLYGGMQDWNYLHGGCLDITIEVNENKWPPPEQLPSLWAEHKGAMLAVLDMLVKSGLHGTVISSEDKRPLLAQIDVEGAGRPVRTRALLGDYHRVLAPGTYIVHVSAPGFKNETATVIIDADAPRVLDFRLTASPAGTPSRRSEGGAFVEGADGEGPLNVGSRVGGRNVTQPLLGKDNATWGVAAGQEERSVRALSPADTTAGDRSLARPQARVGAEGGRWDAGGELEEGRGVKLPQVREADAVMTKGEWGSEGQVGGQERQEEALTQARLRGAQGQRGISLEEGRGRSGDGEEDAEDEDEGGQRRAVPRDRLGAAKGAFDAKDDRKRTGDFGQNAAWVDTGGGEREVVAGAKRAAERKRVEWGVGGRENVGGGDGLDERFREAGNGGRLEALGGVDTAESRDPRIGGAGAGDLDPNGDEIFVGKSDGERPFIPRTGTFPDSPGNEQRTLDSYYAEGRSTWHHLTMAMAVVFTFMLLILWSWLRGRRTRSYMVRGRPARIARVPQIGGPGLFRD